MQYLTIEGIKCVLYLDNGYVHLDAVELPVSFMAKTDTLTFKHDPDAKITFIGDYTKLLLTDKSANEVIILEHPAVDNIKTTISKLRNLFKGIRSLDFAIRHLDEYNNAINELTRNAECSICEQTRIIKDYLKKNADHANARTGTFKHVETPQCRGWD